MATPAPPEVSRWQKVLPFALPVLFAIAIYLPILQADFVYDARAQILTDTFIHQPAHLVDVLSLRVLSLDVLDNNRPMNLLSLMLDSLVWGKNPFGYHLSSVLLHGGNTLLLLLLLRRLLPEAPAVAAPLAAMLFAVHPAISEAVCEATYREDLLATFFTLGALLAAERRPLLCVASLFCAAASKESAWLAPFLLAVLPWPPDRRRWRILAAGIAAVACFAIARQLLKPEVSLIFSQEPPYAGGSFLGTLQVVPRILLLHLTHIVWPAHLSADYTPASIRSLTLPAALTVMILLLAWQTWTSRGKRAALLGVAVFWLALIPVSNLVPIYRPAADRYLYLPMAGLCLWGCAICPWKHRWPTSAAWAAAILACLPLTLARQTVWNNSLSLWRDTVRKSPESITATTNLGSALSDAGDLAGALASFNRAATLAKPGPPFPATAAGAAIVLEAMGDRANADAAFRMAVEGDPVYADPDLLVKSLRSERKHADKLRPIAERYRAGK